MDSHTLKSSRPISPTALQSGSEPSVPLDESPADTVKATTCYMCACRCGIKVYLKNGAVRYIEGNRDHPVNKGVLCGKGAAGIMQHLSPARLQAPLRRVGPRGSGEFEEISWEEALQTASGWLSDVRAHDPRKLAFFTGRDQSQSLTGWWAKQFGTPNYAAHGGFCSVNMAAAGLYTFGGSFWEFGEPDWEHTAYFMLWGVAEDHSSNPIKRGLGTLKQRGTKVTVINPVRTGYGAIADEWLGITPGTDGLFAAALIHELMKAGKVDIEYLLRYTNAHWLVIQNPDGADDGLFARDEDGNPLALCANTGAHLNADAPDITPALSGTTTVQCTQGNVSAVPVLSLIAERFLSTEYAPDTVAKATGISADTIRRIAAELAEAAFEKEITLHIPWTDWAGRKHDTMIGRPVSMHAMRGISAHSNGFHTCRLIHLLQILLGSIDCPGGFRYKPPYPKTIPPAIKPAGKKGEVKANTPLPGAPLGFVTSPDDLLVNDDGVPLRIDKAYSWDAPMSAHGLMHMVINNAATHDPYGIDVLFMYMANMGWNSSMNVPETIRQLTETNPDTGDYRIGKFIYADAFYSETVPYADLILPDTTYLERWDCISMLDRPISEPDRAIDAIRQPVVEPARDVRPFQSVLLDLGARLGLPGMVHADGSPKYPGGYADYIVNHERTPGVGSLAGWRGEKGDTYGIGAINPEQLTRYRENDCFHAHPIAPHMAYFKHANKDYLEWAHAMRFNDSADRIVFALYSEPLQRFRLAARGYGNTCPPPVHRSRVDTFFDPLPFWYAPFEDSHATDKGYRFHAITQRPMHMYHSWGAQNAWLRQITHANRLYLNTERARSLGIGNDDWVALTSPVGRVVCQVHLMDGCNPDTAWTWNAIGKRSGAWGLTPDAPEATQGFLLNHLIAHLLPAREGGYRYSNSDPVTGQAAWYDLRIHIEKIDPPTGGNTPFFQPLKPFRDEMPPSVLQYGKSFS